MASFDLKRLLRTVAFSAFAAFALPACSSAPPPAEAPMRWVPHGPRVEFSYETLDHKTLSTNDLQGRFSVLAFITTYDPASQAEARFVTSVVRRHVPRINAGLVVLEPEENRILVEAFTHVLDPPYPVAMADEATILGNGPFAGLHHVPSVIILDPDGGEAWRHLGLATKELIESALVALEHGQTPPP